jgi:hypothetical protein
MRTLVFLPVLLAASLPVQAAPPPATSTSAQTPAASAPAHRSPIAEAMRDLTRALHDAAAQQAHAQSAVDAAHAKPEATAMSTHDATPLPPDATAQAAVP